MQKTWTYGAPSEFGEIPWRTDGTTTDAHVWNGTTGRLSEWNTTASGVPSILRDFSYDSAGRLVEIARTEGASTLTTALYYDVDDQLVQEDRGSDTYFRFQGHRTSPTGEQTESVLPQIRVYTGASGDQHLRFAYIDVDGQAVHVYAQGGAVMATDVTGIYGVPLQGAPGDYTVTPGNWELDGLHGQEEDRTNEVMHFGARHTMFRDGMWMQPEPMLARGPIVMRDELRSPMKFSGSVYGVGNPLLYQDRSGEMAQTAPAAAVVVPVALAAVATVATVAYIDYASGYQISRGASQVATAVGDSASTVLSSGASAVAGVFTSASQGADPEVVGEIAQGDSIRDAIGKLNEAGASQEQAVGAIEQVVGNSGKTFAGTVEGKDGAKVILGKNVGPATNSVHVGANGKAQIGTQPASVSFNPDSGDVEFKLEGDFVPE
ncbi:MAG: hypothetical protein R3F61_06480 [Myxococcota bacterium]